MIRFTVLLGVLLLGCAFAATWASAKCADYADERRALWAWGASAGALGIACILAWQAVRLVALS